MALQEEIERAFVHLDYECEHHPEHSQNYYPPTPQERGKEKSVGAVLQAGSECSTGDE